MTVAQALALLDGQFALLANGVAADQYAFWLGSGISGNRLDGLPELIEKVLRFLQSRSLGDPTSPYTEALEKAFTLAGLSAGQRAQLDISVDVAAWPPLDDLVNRLRTNYAKLLNIHVGHHPDDYLLWDAVDVRSTYANPVIEPDTEHFRIAMLVLEDVASHIATANWDGLVRIGRLRRVSSCMDDAAY